MLEFADHHPWLTLVGMFFVVATVENVLTVANNAVRVWAARGGVKVKDKEDE